MKNNYHPYHMVDSSPWPILSSYSILIMVLSMIMMMHTKHQIIWLGLISTSLIAYMWWRDVVRESSMQGAHTHSVMISLQWGMILFITSEIMFFMSFFWAFFHSSLAPTAELGNQWPPIGIAPFNPFSIPLLNTAILVSSGASVTWTHHSILNGNLVSSKFSLMLTIILGLYFTLLQSFEYIQASFNISDSSYGTTFFVATGFHGLHVIVGTTFLFICLIRMILLHFTKKHHLGFEMSAWYWHFVDVVWLFLFISIYWWGT